MNGTYTISHVGVHLGSSVADAVSANVCGPNGTTRFVAAVAARTKKGSVSVVGTQAALIAEWDRRQALEDADKELRKSFAAISGTVLVEK